LPVPFPRFLPTVVPADLAATLQEPVRDAPLPGGLAEIIRWFFNVPQWIQIGGAVLGVVLAVFVAAQLWKRRREIREWIRTRSLKLQLGMAAVVVAGIAAASFFGAEAWHYTQHANEFCTACHVMDESYARFNRSEHSKLECHDCHRQPVTASMRQVYLWVLERPEEIGPHAPVPNRICAECHIRERPDSLWERISATAGHRVHLESDTSALAEVMCVTCHGEEVHRFVPANETCGQSDCHSREETRIVLGSMAEQTTMHCLACHEFTAPVPEETTRDTAFAELRPAESQCLGCHEMRPLLADFRAAEDPHRGVCGDCHDPHVQETPATAFRTCTDAGCHDSPETSTPFHRGLAETELAACESCHQAHTWEVSGENCVACHPGIAGSDRTAGLSGPAARGAPGGRVSPAPRR